MKINVSKLSASLERSALEDIPVLKFCFQTEGMSFSIRPFIFGEKNIRLFCEQLSGAVFWYDLVAFNDVNYTLYPHSGGVQIYHFSGESSQAHYVHIPGEVLAERIRALNIEHNPSFELSSEDLQKIAWKYRSRGKLRFLSEEAKQRVLTEIRGKFGPSLRKCIRSEMKVLRRHSDGQIVTLFVSLDHHGFYFEAYNNSPEVCVGRRRLFNGGWIKHDGGYSSHH